jgi:nitroimidazol reductase NimA-like FMN-containing flavoprotein (pyridoxamine 5'-phosphate oxidase superfamily)
MRRSEKSMAQEAALALLQRGFCGRLVTVGAEGHPYCVPLLYVWMNDQVFVHSTSARGHLRANVEHYARVCFEVDEPGEVLAYGRFECDSSLAYQSVVLFGTVRAVDEWDTKDRFCRALMAKYAPADQGRPRGVFPRLDQITVYAIAVERMTGKETRLPDVSQRWPAMDQTRTPWAQTPV